MGGTCSTYGRDEKCIPVSLEIYHFGDIGLYGMIILK
jgi:hypothetical protein